jgi:hypothetical protein
MTILSVKASQILVNQVWELIRGWDAFKKKAFRSFKASQLSIKSGSRFVGDWDALPLQNAKIARQNKKYARNQTPSEVF